MSVKSCSPAHCRSDCAANSVCALQGMHVSQVVCGIAHTLCVTATSQVFAWGSNAQGQLGTGHAECRRAPTFIDGLWAMPVHQLAAGASCIQAYKCFGLPLHLRTLLKHAWAWLLPSSNHSPSSSTWRPCRLLGITGHLMLGWIKQASLASGPLYPRGCQSMKGSMSEFSCLCWTRALTAASFAWLTSWQAWGLKRAGFIQQATSSHPMKSSTSGILSSWSRLHFPCDLGDNLRCLQ